MVLYRAGRLQEAHEALEKALEYNWLEDAADLFALAMTQSKLEQPAEARHTYERAVKRKESAPNYPPYIQLQDEAKQLLGLR